MPKENGGGDQTKRKEGVGVIEGFEGQPGTQPRQEGNVPESGSQKGIKAASSG